MDNKKFSLKARFKSFYYAFRGITTLIRNEHNARIHLTATIFVISTGIYTHLSPSEWCIIVLLIGLVFMAEAFNSAIEYLADRISPDYHPLIKAAKDVAAGAVLFIALASAIIGLIIFIPKF